VLTETRQRVEGKEKRVHVLAGASVDPHAMRNAVLSFNHLRGLWKHRKDICMDAVSNIAEQVGKKVDVTMRELELESDKDAKADMPPPMKEV